MLLPTGGVRIVVWRRQTLAQLRLPSTVRIHEIETLRPVGESLASLTGQSDHLVFRSNVQRVLSSTTGETIKGAIRMSHLIGTLISQGPATYLHFEELHRFDLAFRRLAQPGKKIDNFDQAAFLSAGQDGIFANETVSRCRVKDVNGRVIFSGDHVDGDVVESYRIELDQRSTSVFSGSRLDSSIHQLILSSSFQQGTARVNRIAMRVGVSRFDTLPGRIGTRLELERTGERFLHRIQRKGANGRSSNRISISEREI